MSHRLLNNTERGHLAGEMEQFLRRQVMDAWFPRCIDTEAGGFTSGFDRQWRPEGPQQRLLEFQARQTRAAARISAAYPDDGRWAEYALHGFRWLRDAGWDRDHGGWYWLTDSGGEPLAAATKHAHSGSYAVQACAAVYRATGERSALEFAEQGFDWFERHAHDTEFGGYHSWLKRDGTPIFGRTGVPQGAGPEDPLDHAPGLKSTNVHGDWFEALADLAAVAEDSRVRERRGEFASIYLDRLTTLSGAMNYTFHRDWNIAPGPDVHGYGFQAVHRLLDAANDVAVAGLEDRAMSLFLHAVRAGRRRGGGYASETRPPSFAPLARYQHRRRAWWPQFEALRSLAIVAARPGKWQAAAGRALERQWRFIQTELADEKYGGIYGTAPADLLPWARPSAPRSGRYLEKGGAWKDCSHDAEGLLRSIAELRGS